MEQDPTEQDPAPAGAWVPVEQVCAGDPADTAAEASAEAAGAGAGSAAGAAGAGVMAPEPLALSVMAGPQLMAPRLTRPKPCGMKRLT